jgi:hypothetical protein
MGGKSAVGRTGALRMYKYPEPRSAGTSAFARNFATGPKTATALSDTPTQVRWNAIDVGTSPGTDVPITPRVTGVVRIIAVLSVQNASGDDADMAVKVQIDGSDLPLPDAEVVSIRPGSSDVVVVLVETTLPLNTTSNVQITLATGNSDQTATLIQDSSSMEVQEVSNSTG